MTYSEIVDNTLKLIATSKGITTFNDGVRGHEITFNSSEFQDISKIEISKVLNDLESEGIISWNSKFSDIFLIIDDGDMFSTDVGVKDNFDKWYKQYIDLKYFDYNLIDDSIVKPLLDFTLMLMRHYNSERNNSLILEIADSKIELVNILINAKFISNLIKEEKDKTYTFTLKGICLPDLIKNLKDRMKSINSVEIESKSDNNSFKIKYTKSREIIFNDLICISKMDFDSENDKVFNFLINNANIELSKEVLEKALNYKLTKDLNKIVENLGFKRDLRKIFFNVAKNTIMFRNPVSKKEFDELGIVYIRF